MWGDRQVASNVFFMREECLGTIVFNLKRLVHSFESEPISNRTVIYEPSLRKVLIYKMYHGEKFMSHQIKRLSSLFVIVLFAVIGGAGVLTAVSTPIIHAASNVYVNDATGSDSNDCATAVTACKTIGEGINKATAGDIILVATGVYSEHITLSKSVTISGTGSSNVFVDGSYTGRVFTINSSANVTLQGMTMRNGSVDGSPGGGIYNAGTLILKNSAVLSNTATNNSGGAIGNIGTLTITQSILAHNSTVSGGAIYSYDGTLVLQDVTVRDNFAASTGGAFFLEGGGTVIMERTTINSNQAGGNSGAFHAQSGVSVQLINVTISGNTADNFSAFGSNTTVSFLNSTIVNNVSTSSSSDRIAISNYGTLNFQNSIVANTIGNDSNCYNGGGVTSLGYNLSDDATCAFTGAGDIQSIDPQLGALADNGGGTQTHALLVGSPAVDSGANSGCPSTDQRGAIRPFDGDNDGTATCDIGAYELSNQVSIADRSVMEGDSGTVTAVFTVTLAPTSTQPVTVTYATADGTASAGSDYTATSGTLVFAPNQGSKTVNVAVLGDTVDEPNETFFVNLSNIEGAQLMDAQAVGQIVDDDGLPALMVNDVTVVEGDTVTVTAVFTVTLSPSSGQAVTVQYATTDGTASAGSDYTAAAGTVTFAPGETEKSVAVTVQGDVIDEGSSETFTFNLSNPTNAAIQDGSGTGTITDDDTAALSAANIYINEGSIGVFTVTLSTPSATTVTVDYATSDATAIAGSDYVAISGTLTFTAGITEQMVAVQTINNGAVEAQEYFHLLFSNAQGATIANSSAVGYIMDAASSGQFQFLQAAYTVQEDVITATITVARVGGVFGAVGVNYATSDGTAVAGSDYTAVSGTLSFADGETSKTFTIPITADTVAEGDETVNLTLSNPTGGATMGTPNTAVLTIENTGQTHLLYLPIIIK